MKILFLTMQTKHACFRQPVALHQVDLREARVKPGAGNLQSSAAKLHAGYSGALAAVVTAASAIDPGSRPPSRRRAGRVKTATRLLYPPATELDQLNVPVCTVTAQPRRRQPRPAAIKSCSRRDRIRGARRRHDRTENGGAGAESVSSSRQLRSYSCFPYQHTHGVCPVRIYA